MAPTKPTGKGPSKGKTSSKSSSKTGSKTSSSKAQPKRAFKPSKSEKSSSAEKAHTIRKATVQQKTKSKSHGPLRKKKRTYTDKELGIPLLNSIKPAGIQKPHGMKKGKTFVDDKESMMAILALVQAEKEGNIESKMLRARHMEEVRQARKAEAEMREGMRRKKLEATKDELRKPRKKKTDLKRSAPDAAELEADMAKPKKKRVSFG